MSDARAAAAPIYSVIILHRVGRWMHPLAKVIVRRGAIGENCIVVVPPDPVVWLARELSPRLEAGTSLVPALAEIAENADEGPIPREVLDQLRLGLLRGISLSDGLSHYPDVFLPDLVAVLLAAEEACVLHEVLHGLASTTSWLWGGPAPQLSPDGVELGSTA